MADQPLYKDQALTVEPHGIEHIGEAQRHGRPINQFTIRFSPVIYLAAIVVGGAAVPLGLGLSGTVSAIVLGNLLGSICTSACAVMGPGLGMPQLAMGRAAFGYLGNYVPAITALMLYIGYNTVGTILGSQSLADLFALPYIPVAIGVSAASVLIAVFGYNLLHVFGRWITRISIVVLVVVSVFLALHGLGPGALGRLDGGDYWLVWLLEFTIVFAYTMSWAPYASDYSRYLPVTTSRRKVFGWSFLGLFLATTWMMTLGAVLMTFGLESVLTAIDMVLPGWLVTIVLLTLGVSAIPHNSVNLYSGAMSCLTWNLPLRRSVTVVIGGVLGCLLAVFFGGPDFQQHYNAFLFLVSYYVTPWLAIVCVDFYWRHRGGRGYPAVSEFYRRDGVLRGFRWSGLVAFALAIAVSVPFMATDLYVGPIGAALGGADLSYFVSFVVAGALFAATSRRVDAVVEPLPSQRERRR